MAALLVEDLALNLNGRQILREVSLRVEAGQVHCLIGPNGAGKSSVAYAVMGLPGFRPQKGRVWLLGEEITGLPVDERARRGMTLAWQEPARFEGLKVSTYLAAGARDDSPEVLDEALEAVALSPLEYMRRAVDRTLSGGERKRIELASIVTMEPKVVILDEPDSGIDVGALRSLYELLEKLRGRGAAVLVITHSDEMLKHADYASLICAGTIVKEGAPRTIRRYFTDRCLPCPTKVYPTGSGERE